MNNAAITEPSSFATKISDGTTIDLSLLSKKELQLLHFNEETYCAQTLLQLPPFSDERRILLNKGYSLVHTIMMHINGESKQSLGA